MIILGKRSVGRACRPKLYPSPAWMPAWISVAKNKLSQTLWFLV